jgi:hypothetical protein
MYICIYVYIYMYIHIFIHVSIPIYILILYMYTYTYTYTYIHIYIYTHTHTQDLSICPLCNAAGARRPDCRNAVVNRKDKLQPYSQENTMLVCCCVGDETKTFAPNGQQ